MGYKIFLSHSSADERWVKWIATNARSVGIEVYLYQYDPQPGTPLDQKIPLRIQECDALVVFITANARYSQMVHQEIGIAKGKQKLIIPLVQPGVPSEALGMLQGREYVPFDFQNPQQGLGTLLQYLQNLKQLKEKQQLALAVLGLGAIIALAFLGGKQ